MGWAIKGRWWNGSWGKRDRRDIRLSTDGQIWRVEARQGSEARWWERDYRTEVDARRLVAAMLARSGDTWTDLTSISTDGPVNPYR